ARGSSGRYGLCNRLSVLYFPFSETTPKWKSKKSPERITDFHSIKTDMPLSIQVCNVRQR
ncbi:hypothetical protein, partial [Escherichia coli]|uniref:hypothetical protein n=1 Tax=Escherichia coli TaxID=562 RepID=UPI000BE42166